MASYKSTKLFNLEDRKRQTGKATTEVDIFQWKSTLLEELRKNDQFTEHLKSTSTWSPPKVTNRGFAGATPEASAKQVEDMLTKISSLAPSCLVRAIRKRTTCLVDVWALVSDWAGIQTTGSRHLDYYRVKKSWKPDGDETKQEFFYRLKDSMEDTLISAANNIQEDGKVIAADEDMTPCINSIVVMDWVDAVGGGPLVEHVHRVYAKDMESVTLGSLQSRISKNLDSLLHEIEEQKVAQANRVEHFQPSQPPPHRPFPQNNRGWPASSRNRGERQFPPPTTRRPIQQSSRYQTSAPPSTSPTQLRYCKLCRSRGTHTLANCPNLSFADRSQIAKARQTSSNQLDVDQVDVENEVFEEEEEYEEEEPVEQYTDQD